MRNTLLSLAFFGLVASACATPQPVYVTGDPDRQIREAEFVRMGPEISAFTFWDADNDRYLTAAEFETGMRSLGLDAPHGFEAWDIDRDRRLSADEFYRGTFRELAADRDFVTEREIAENRYLVAW